MDKFQRSLNAQLSLRRYRLYMRNFRIFHVTKEMALGHIKWLREGSHWQVDYEGDVPSYLLEDFARAENTISQGLANDKLKMALLKLSCKVCQCLVTYSFKDCVRDNFEKALFDEALRSFTTALRCFTEYDYETGFYEWLKALRLSNDKGDEAKDNITELLNLWWIDGWNLKEKNYG